MMTHRRHSEQLLEAEQKIIIDSRMFHVEFPLASVIFVILSNQSDLNLRKREFGIKSYSQ
jgi:hypothetical protein